MEEEVAAKVVEEIIAESTSDATAEAVAAETAYGVAAEASNDVEFNESESFDGSNSSESTLKSHDFAIDHEAFFPNSEYFCSGSGNELVVEDEGDIDAAGAAKSTVVVIQPLAEVDFCGYLVPHDGVQFLEAMWKKTPTLMMSPKPKILEWKSVVQELMKEGFKLDFIFENFPRFLETYLANRIVARVTAEATYGVVAEAAADVVAKVVNEVILEIIENASNLQEILAVGNSPQDRDCDLGKCESADFYELLLALLVVHHSFVVASANIVMIEKECINVVGTTELISGAIAEPSTTDLSSLVLRQNFLQQIMIPQGDDLAFVVP
uniref:Uncharacterized protein n=1 Tax=Fagus sylvatica TaxID=28930 RepID=A0A2N9FWM8_FAGSY